MPIFAQFDYRGINKTVSLSEYFQTVEHIVQSVFRSSLYKMAEVITIQDEKEEQEYVLD
jgi:hypothetical protein